MKKVSLDSLEGEEGNINKFPAAKSNRMFDSNKLLLPLTSNNNCLNIGARSTRSFSNKETRRDKFGNTISKKNKDYKVSFRDQFKHGKLHDVKVVESYREHNRLDEPEKTSKEYN